MEEGGASYKLSHTSTLYTLVQLNKKLIEAVNIGGTENIIEGSLLQYIRSIMLYVCLCPVPCSLPECRSHYSCIHQYLQRRVWWPRDKERQQLSTLPSTGESMLIMYIHSLLAMHYT